MKLREFWEEKAKKKTRDTNSFIFSHWWRQKDEFSIEGGEILVYFSRYMFLCQGISSLKNIPPSSSRWWILLIFFPLKYMFPYSFKMSHVCRGIFQDATPSQSWLSIPGWYFCGKKHALSIFHFLTVLFHWQKRWRRLVIFHIFSCRWNWRIFSHFFAFVQPPPNPLRMYFSQQIYLWYMGTHWWPENFFMWWELWKISGFTKSVFVLSILLFLYQGREYGEKHEISP